jgi:hypothetical protein
MKQPQELGVIPDQASADDAASLQSAGEAITPQVGPTSRDLWGDAAGALYDRALEAAHKFAHASGCPAGYSVFDWLDLSSDRLTAAHREWRRASRQADGTEAAQTPAKQSGMTNNPSLEKLAGGERR